jgi:hypothetical protein
LTVVDFAPPKRGKQATACHMQKARRKEKVFDKAAAFAKTRREIERHARYKGAADTDDLYRWLVAWVWFNPQAKDPVGAVMVSAAYAMGRKNLAEAAAEAVVDEARETRKRMTADALAAWLGCTLADRDALGLTRIGACDVRKEARDALRKERRRLAQQRRRHDRGMKPREEWRAANSLSRTRPWESEGINRATWYRRRRRASRQTRQARSARLRQA